VGRADPEQVGRLDKLPLTARQRADDFASLRALTRLAQVQRCFSTAAPSRPRSFGLIVGPSVSDMTAALDHVSSSRTVDRPAMVVRWSATASSLQVQSPARARGEAGEEAWREQGPEFAGAIRRARTVTTIQQTIEQFLAELPGAMRSRRFCVRRADDAYVAAISSARQAVDRPLLQEAQQLRLQRHRRSPISSRNSGALVRGLDAAWRGLACTGERALS